MRKIVYTVLVLLFCITGTSAQNSTILITAATGAFGEAVSFSLAAEGYNLLVAGRDQKKLDDLQKRLKEKFQSISVKSIIIDFSNTKTIEDAVKQISHNLNGVVLIGPRPLFYGKDSIPAQKEWNRVFSETFTGPLEVLRLFSPMIQDNGSIVIISGNSSKNYLPNYPNTNVIRLAWTGELKNLVHFFCNQKN